MWCMRSQEPLLHPGALLQLELRAMGLTVRDIVRKVPAPHRARIERDITDFLRANPDDSCVGIDTCLFLDRLFGLRRGTWWHLQAEYEADFYDREEAWIRDAKPMHRKAAPRTREKLYQLAGYVEPARKANRS